MKKNKLILIILIIFLIGLLALLFFSLRNSNGESLDDEKISEEEKEQLIEDINDDIKEDTGDANENTDNGDNNTNSDKKYDQYLVANGYSGASDNVYYTKDNVLYHLVLSTEKITKIAEGVLKIENAKGTIIVHRGDNFKVFEEDNYLTYVD